MPEFIDERYFAWADEVTCREVVDRVGKALEADGWRIVEALVEPVTTTRGQRFTGYLKCVREGDRPMVDGMTWHALTVRQAAA